MAISPVPVLRSLLLNSMTYLALIISSLRFGIKDQAQALIRSLQCVTIIL